MDNNRIQRAPVSENKSQIFSNAIYEGGKDSEDEPRQMSPVKVNSLKKNRIKKKTRGLKRAD